jgi:hypothetical protein
MLLTVQVNRLQSITLVLSPHVILNALTSDEVQQGWLDLDRLLVKFWTSYSLRPKFVYEWVGVTGDLEDDVPKLLPESARRGIVDLVKHSASAQIE